MPEDEARDTPPRRIPRWAWAAAGVSALLLFAGGFFVGHVTAYRAVVRGAKHVADNQEQIPRQIAARMAASYDLSADQEEALHGLLTSYYDQVQALRVFLRPRLAERLEQFRQDIAQVLTPEQAIRWNDDFDKLRDGILRMPEAPQTSD